VYVGSMTGLAEEVERLLGIKTCLLSVVSLFSD
jgi:hypothetical protein